MEVIAPAIVLVEPQLGDNVGAAARAMLNCSLTDLRLVRPRDGRVCFDLFKRFWVFSSVVLRVSVPPW